VGVSFEDVVDADVFAVEGGAVKPGGDGEAVAFFQEGGIEDGFAVVVKEPDSAMSCSAEGLLAVAAGLTFCRSGNAVGGYGFIRFGSSCLAGRFRIRGASQDHRTNQCGGNDANGPDFPASNEHPDLLPAALPEHRLTLTSLAAWRRVDPCRRLAAPSDKYCSARKSQTGEPKEADPD
jgi:hypothetical protein